MFGTTIDNFLRATGLYIYTKSRNGWKAVSPYIGSATLAILSFGGASALAAYAGAGALDAPVNDLYHAFFSASLGDQIYAGCCILSSLAVNFGVSWYFNPTAYRRVWNTMPWVPEREKISFKLGLCVVMALFAAFTTGITNGLAFRENLYLAYSVGIVNAINHFATRFAGSFAFINLVDRLVTGNEKMLVDLIAFLSNQDQTVERTIDYAPVATSSSKEKINTHIATEWIDQEAGKLMATSQRATDDTNHIKPISRFNLRNISFYAGLVVAALALATSLPVFFTNASLGIDNTTDFLNIPPATGWVNDVVSLFGALPNSFFYFSSCYLALPTMLLHFNEAKQQFQQASACGKVGRGLITLGSYIALGFGLLSVVGTAERAIDSGDMEDKISWIHRIGILSTLLKALSYSNGFFVNVRGFFLALLGQTNLFHEPQPATRMGSDQLDDDEVQLLRQGDVNIVNPHTMIAYLEKNPFNFSKAYPGEAALRDVEMQLLNTNNAGTTPGNYGSINDSLQRSRPAGANGVMYAARTPDSQTTRRESLNHRQSLRQRLNGVHNFFFKTNRVIPHQHAAGANGSLHPEANLAYRH